MADEIRSIKLSLIVVPEYMRQHSQDKLLELAKDMKEQGQLQNIGVTPIADGQFELVFGGGRVAAAKLNGWEEIRCLVMENLTEEAKALRTIAENDDREDVSPIDRGLSYIRAMKAGDMSQDVLAQKIGKTQAYISQYIAAASLAEPVLEIIKRFIIGIGYINQIVRLASDDAKIAMLERCQKEGLSVRQLESLVNKASQSKADEGAPSEALAKDGGVPKPKPSPKGIKCVKSGKGFHLAGGFKDLIPMDDFLKSAREAYQLLLDEQAAQQANSKPHSGMPKPDPEAMKAAKAAMKAAMLNIASLAKEIEGLETAAKGLEKIKRDSSGIRQEIAQKQAEIKALKDKIKEANKANTILRKGPVKKAAKGKPSDINNGEIAPQTTGESSTSPAVRKDVVEGSQAGGKGQSEGIGDSHTFVLPLPQELTSKCESELARLEKEYKEANTPEEKAAKKAMLQQARLTYNNLRKEFGTAPIDFPEIS